MGGQTFRTPVSQPLIVGQRLYVVVGSRVLDSYDLGTGRRLWRWETPQDRLLAGLVHDSGRVIIQDRLGRVTGVDAATGRTAWTRQLPDQWAFDFTPVARPGVARTGAARSRR